MISCQRQEEVPKSEDDTVIEEYDLSSIKRIALVSISGFSESSPNDTIHHTLMNSVWNKFRMLMEADTTIEFIPVEQVINNEIYKSMKSSIPDLIYSPINGLGNIKPSNDEEIDCGPLLESLNADACLAVGIIWGNRARVKNAEYHITAYVESGLYIPPEKEIWRLTGSSKYFDDKVPIKSFKAIILSLGMGFRWVLFMPPSEKQYVKLTKYAIEKDTKIAENVADSIYYKLLTSIQN